MWFSGFSYEILSNCWNKPTIKIIDNSLSVGKLTKSVRDQIMNSSTVYLCLTILVGSSLSARKSLTSPWHSDLCTAMSRVWINKCNRLSSLHILTGVMQSLHFIIQTNLFLLILNRWLHANTHTHTHTHSTKHTYTPMQLHKEKSDLRYVSSSFMDLFQVIELNINLSQTKWPLCLQSNKEDLGGADLLWATRLCRARFNQRTLVASAPKPVGSSIQPC